MSTAAPSPAQEQPPLSQAERVMDTFIAPGKTFTDIRRSASWWVPWLLSAIFGCGLVLVVDKKVGLDAVFENGMRLSPKQAQKMERLSPEQRDRQKEIAIKFTRGFGYAFPVMMLIIVAVIAGILLGTFNFAFGAQLTFAQSFAISMYAFLPGTIKTLLAIAIVLAGAGAGFTFQEPIASNLGGLVDPSSPFLHSIASSVDVFTIWILILTAIGYSCLTKGKRGTCYGVVFGWWVANTLLWAAVAALLS
jgi:Yip1 domain